MAGSLYFMYEPNALKLIQMARFWSWLYGPTESVKTNCGEFSGSIVLEYKTWYGLGFHRSLLPIDSQGVNPWLHEDPPQGFQYVKLQFYLEDDFDYSRLNYWNKHLEVYFPNHFTNLTNPSKEFYLLRLQVLQVQTFNDSTKIYFHINSSIFDTHYK